MRLSPVTLLRAPFGVGGLPSPVASITTEAAIPKGTTALLRPLFVQGRDRLTIPRRPGGRWRYRRFTRSHRPYDLPFYGALARIGLPTELTLQAAITTGPTTMGVAHRFRMQQLGFHFRSTENGPGVLRVAFRRSPPISCCPRGRPTPFDCTQALAAESSHHAHYP